MPAPTRFWSELSTADFATLDTARAIAVLPVAAIEQHGPHLPLSVDTDIVNGVLQAALPHIAADLPVLVLPTQAVGFSPEHTLGFRRQVGEEILSLLDMLVGKCGHVVQLHVGNG